jgi:hypothetical protein
MGQTFPSGRCIIRCATPRHKIRPRSNPGMGIPPDGIDQALPQAGPVRARFSSKKVVDVTAAAASGTRRDRLSGSFTAAPHTHTHNQQKNNPPHSLTPPFFPANGPLSSACARRFVGTPFAGNRQFAVLTLNSKSKILLPAHLPVPFGLLSSV